MTIVKDFNNPLSVCKKQIKDVSQNIMSSSITFKTITSYIFKHYAVLATKIHLHLKCQ